MKSTVLHLLLLCTFHVYCKTNTIYHSTERVIGGENAREHEFPFLLSLQEKSLFFGYKHICGASIVNEKWVLTAGHCVDTIFGTYKVIANITNLKETGIERNVIEKIIHEEYIGGVAPNDIALLRLEFPIDFGYGVQPVILPNRCNGKKTYGIAVLAGWGYIEESIFPKMSDALQKISLPIIQQRDCERAVQKINGAVYPLVETNICTGPLTGNMSVCSGDSGGPLSQNGVLIGIVSWGFLPCGRSEAPSVYTEVSNYIDWISDNIK